MQFFMVLILIWHGSDGRSVVKLSEQFHQRPHTLFDEIEKANGKYNQEYFETDIILDSDLAKVLNTKDDGEIHNRKRRDVRIDRTWTNGVVPYRFADDFHPPDIVEHAMGEIERVSCVRFVKRMNEKDFVEFIHGGGCYSNIGRVGGRQPISLSFECLWRDIIIHEILHTLGFYHEQARLDRLEHIFINWDNIREDRIDQFRSYNIDEADYYGGEFDKHSIMMYNNWISSKDPNAMSIISRTDPNELLGSADGMSKTDILQLNNKYQCQQKQNTCRDKLTICTHAYKNLCTLWQKFKEDCPVTCDVCRIATTRPKLSTTNLKPLATHSRQSTTNLQPSTTNSRPSTTNSRPSTTNSQPSTTNSQQSTTNLQQSTTNLQQSTTNLQPSRTKSQQSTTNSQQSTTNSQQSTTNSQQSTTNSQQSTTNSQQSTTNIPQLLSTITSKPSTTKLKPLTAGSQPATRVSQPSTTNSQPLTLTLKSTTTNSQTSITTSPNSTATRLKQSTKNSQPPTTNSQTSPTNSQPSTTTIKTKPLITISRQSPATSQQSSTKLKSSTTTKLQESITNTQPPTTNSPLTISSKELTATFKESSAIVSQLTTLIPESSTSTKKPSTTTTTYQQY